VSIATQFQVGTVTVTGASNVRITNVNAAVSGTEYSLALVNGLKRIVIRSRLLATTQFTFTSGQSGTTYITVPPGCTFNEGGIELSGTTLYLQTSANSNTVEILEFY